MFNAKFTFTTTIVIGILLAIGGAVFGAYTGNYEIMYTGAALLTARTGIEKIGKK